MLSSSLFKEQRRKPKGELMSYLVLKGTVIGGKQVRAGDVVEVEGVEARDLIGMGRIIEVVKTETKVEDRSVGLTEETKPKRRTRKKAM